MSVSVNLQEVFSSDSQSNLTQKINFNFNQLLTLGLGEPGPIGLTGPQGPIGPAGPLGPAGARGAKVYAVQTLDSPIVTPAIAPNSADGDIFVNTRELYVKGVTVSGTWGEVIDFQSLITSQSLQDTFKVFQLGVGDGDSTSKHAKFLRTTGVDTVNSGLAQSHPMYYSGQATNNTQLILSNFDEFKTWKIQAGTLVANTSESDDIFEYNSLAKIYAFLPSSLSSWRHQLEIGSVDDVAVTVGGSTQQYVLTPAEQNLKIRKYRVAAASLDGGLYNRAEFDLSGSTSSINSLNGEILFSVNKRSTTAQVIQMGLTTAQILADRLPSQALATDGLIMSKAGTYHFALGFDNTTASKINLKTSSNLTSLALNHASFDFANGNLAITLADPTKEISLGTAIKVKNDRLSQGLPFPTTMVASTDPNTLDDYEEGTWTPTVDFTNTLVYGSDNNAGSNWQTSNPVGRYIKIGKAIYLYFSINVRFILDSGVEWPTQLNTGLQLGITSSTAFVTGSELYGLRIGGMPFGKTDASGDFIINIDSASAGISGLRKELLRFIATENQQSVFASVTPIVPGTAFGKYSCVGTAPNRSPRIQLNGFRYKSTDDLTGFGDTQAAVSRITAHDFLRLYSTSTSTFSVITGHGWILDNGDCNLEENVNNPGEGLGFGVEPTTTTTTTQSGNQTNHNTTPQQPNTTQTTKHQQAGGGVGAQ